MLLVPDGSSSTGGLTAAGPGRTCGTGSPQGGTYIGLRNEGTRMARAAGLTSTTEKAKPAGLPGDRARTCGSTSTTDSPVALGRPAEDFEFNNCDPILNPSTTGTNVLTLPDGRHVLGQRLHGRRATPLKGTAAVVDEPTGAGRAVLFAFNPLFRAYNENGLHLWPTRCSTRRRAPRTPRRRRRVDRARARRRRRRAGTPDLGGEWRPITDPGGRGDLAARASRIVDAYTDDRPGRPRRTARRTS